MGGTMASWLPRCLPMRWETALLMFVGGILNYTLRFNFSIAVVEMNNVTSIVDGSIIHWAPDQKNYLLSAFFYGYVVLQIPGGRLAELYGTKRVFGLTMLGTTILAAFTPLAAKINFWCLFVLRVMQGVLEGVTFPSFNPMTARWAPEEERGRFMSFAYMGGTVGTVVTYPLCGLLLKYSNWETVFYVSSAASAIWCLAWFLLVHDLPEDHPRITPEERDLILTSRTFDASNRERELKTPIFPLIWDMVRTPGVLVDMLTDFCSGWGNIMILSESPTFMKEVLGFDIAQNGVLNMLPHLCRAIVGQISGLFSDLGLKHGWTRLSIQKFNVVTSFLLPAAGLVAISQLSTNDLKYWCVAAMAIGYSFNGTSYSGHYSNIITIGPNRSGTTFGLVNCAGNIPGFLMPLVVNAFTANDPSSSSQWGYVFWIFAGMYVLGCLIFLFFAKGSVQEFNSKDYIDGHVTANEETHIRYSYKKTNYE